MKNGNSMLEFVDSIINKIRRHWYFSYVGALWTDRVSKRKTIQAKGLCQELGAKISSCFGIVFSDKLKNFLKFVQGVF